MKPNVIESRSGNYTFFETEAAPGMPVVSFSLNSEKGQIMGEVVTLALGDYLLDLEVESQRTPRTSATDISKAIGAFAHVNGNVTIAFGEGNDWRAIHILADDKSPTAINRRNIRNELSQAVGSDRLGITQLGVVAEDRYAELLIFNTLKNCGVTSMQQMPLEGGGNLITFPLYKHEFRD